MQCSVCLVKRLSAALHESTKAKNFVLTLKDRMKIRSFFVFGIVVQRRQGREVYSLKWLCTLCGLARLLTLKVYLGTIPVGLAHTATVRLAKIHAQQAATAGRFIPPGKKIPDGR
jgi:hypothetical protein